MTENNFILVDHPGTFIEEELEARGWTQKDLAYILGWKPQTLNKIIKGQIGISPENAQAFGEAFDVPAEFFSNLQKMYDLSRLAPPDGSVRTRARWAEHFPIRKMIERKWISDTDPDLIDTQMLRFFECKSISEVPFIGSAPIQSYAAKKRDYSETTPLQFLWLHRVRQIAETFIDCPEFDENLLRSKLPEIRRHMLQRSDIAIIPEILRTCGIRFILVEALPGANVDGVCFWLDRNKPVIAMTTLYDRMDNFCFVLMHEITHVLNGDGKDVGFSAIDSEETLSSSQGISEQERIANESSADFLIPFEKMESFYDRKAPFISERDILSFAALHEIHPSIVVGQIQRRSLDYTKYRKHLKKIREHLLGWDYVDGWGKVVEIQL